MEETQLMAAVMDGKNSIVAQLVTNYPRDIDDADSE